MLIDTHSHISFEDYKNDRKEVITRAVLSGVSRIVDVGIDIESNISSLKLSQQFEGTVFATAGFHPHYASKFDFDKFKDIYEENEQKFIAIGEIGLDFFRDLSPRNQQLKVFTQLLSFGIEKEVTLIFHCREAYNEMLNILKTTNKELKGIMHCYSGGFKYLDEVLSLGLFVSVGGPVTYPKSSLQEIIKKIPLDKLILETDAPYLTPQIFRGKRNEPSYIKFIAEKISQILEVDLKKIEEFTSNNAEKVFSLPSKEIFIKK